MSSRAIVILFNSLSELNTLQITSLVAKLASMADCPMDDITAKQLNSNDIAECICETIAKAEGVNHIKFTKEEPEMSAETAALVYVAGKFANDLTGPNKNLIRFSSNFATHITMAKITGSDYKMLQALSILRNCEPKDFTKALKTKLGITDTIFGIIKQVAKNVQD